MTFTVQDLMAISLRKVAHDYKDKLPNVVGKAVIQSSLCFTFVRVRRRAGGSMIGPKG